MKAILQFLKELWLDERGIAALASLIPAAASLLGGSGGGDSSGGGGGTGGLLGSLFNIGSAVTGLFGGGPESEILKTFEAQLAGSRNRERQLQGLMAPFNQLAFQSLGNYYGLNPGNQYDLGLLGIETQGIEDFVDPRSAKKIASKQDKITQLQSKQARKIAAGKGTSKLQQKIQQQRAAIEELSAGQGIPEDVLAEQQKIQAGIKDPFDIGRAAEQGGLGLQQQAIIRQIEETVPPGGLRDKLISDAISQYGLQKGLLDTESDIFRRNFISGFPQTVMQEFQTLFPSAAGAAGVGLQNDQNTLSGLMGAGQALASGVSGLDDFLSQFGTTGTTNRVGIDPLQRTPTLYSAGSALSPLR